MSKKYLLVLFVVLYSAKIFATSTWTPQWDSISISAIGPKSAGDINISAKRIDSDELKLVVKSNYGEFNLQDDLKKPQIQTITVTRYGESVKNYTDLFYVCLFFGDEALVNKGTREKPRNEWQPNLAVYTFSKGSAKLKRFKNTDKTWFFPECLPIMGI
ncbi:hypothetical protein KO525_18025 [Psychrosphaera sp. B3R10]|uniref:Uncharacterized protein n=1 Tax=Psychrosphaera algicola TaxID=3023714 RepID=A0ABT5FH63_9GAMM|nr:MULTISPECIES: hypothetical protein [unclassified Psychrosphaera]MBU2882886.1 hypothetical protein [Psychrosphaera sp. I2R16]MBU2991282.1 hypothetical protein [Psychrosphaera sp. B3R10]MDC2890533.1 hypothetical protein [Psychrosphaera sp. G1-22]